MVMFLWLFVFIGAHVLSSSYLRHFTILLAIVHGLTRPNMSQCNAGECERVALCTTVSWHHLFLLAYFSHNNYANIRFYTCQLSTDVSIHWTGLID